MEGTNLQKAEYRHFQVLRLKRPEDRILHYVGVMAVQAFSRLFSDQSLL